MCIADRIIGAFVWLLSTLRQAQSSISGAVSLKEQAAAWLRCPTRSDAENSL